MKYYGRSPSEIREKLDKTGTRSMSSKRLSRMILFVDLILVILVGLYFQRNVKEIKTPNVEKSFEFMGVKLLSSCREGIGCRIRIHSPGALLNIQRIQWSVKSNPENPESIYELAGKPGQVKASETYEDVFSFPLTIGQVVHVNFLFDAQPEGSQFQVFP